MLPQLLPKTPADISLRVISGVEPAASDGRSPALIGRHEAQRGARRPVSPAAERSERRLRPDVLREAARRARRRSNSRASSGPPEVVDSVIRRGCPERAPACIRSFSTSADLRSMITRVPILAPESCWKENWVVFG